MPFEEQDWLTAHVPGEVLIYLGFVSPRDLRDVHEGFAESDPIALSIDWPVGL